MGSKKSVVIVGAGVFGCSTAYHLTRLGIKPLVIERESIGARASGKAWGMMGGAVHGFMLQYTAGKFYYMPPEETGGTTPFLDLYDNNWYRLKDIAYDIKEKTGVDIEYGEGTWSSLVTNESAEEEALLRHAPDLLKEQGFNTTKWIEADEVRAIYPDISPTVRGALIAPLLQVEPYKYTLGLAQTAEKLGAEFKQGDVVGVERDKGRVTAVILASGTRIEADVFVFTTGPWIQQLTSQMGHQLPITVAQEQCLRVKVAKRMPLHVISSKKVSIAPKVNGEVIIGVSGGKDLVEDLKYVSKQAIFDQFMEDAVELLPSIADSELLEFRGDLECWNRGPAYAKPIIGPLPDLENCFIGGGGNTQGITLSAGVGSTLASLVTGDILKYSTTEYMVEHCRPKY